MRLMSRKRHRQRERCRRQIRDHGFIASVYKRKRSPCQQDNSSPCGEGIRSGLNLENLPEDICRHIHALMPLRDAARAACASRTFLRSWRCRPNLSLSGPALSGNYLGKDEMAGDLISNIDHILKNHSGDGMKKLRLSLDKKVDSCYLDSWLHIAITAGIEELAMFLSCDSEEPYNFPCSLLFNGSENSIWHLHLGRCAFRPTAELGCCRSLTSLFLSDVWIADDELEWLLSNSFTLEELRLRDCNEIVCLKIPCLLQRLSFLSVSHCRKLQVIESNAPNISSFLFCGGTFRPTAELGCCRSLTSLFLCDVWIADDELEWLLSNSFTLEELRLRDCNEIVCLKIPCLLQRLSFLSVSHCRKLQVIESNAPNISTFLFCGRIAHIRKSVQISFGGALQVKNIEMSSHQTNVVWYARTKLLPCVPNVETLAITSSNETISTPMLPGKFVHLKYLNISLGALYKAVTYDYLSLVSFLEASPCLETFIFRVWQRDMNHDSIIGDSSHLRQLPEHRHQNLKSVTIVGFCSAKSFVELTCYIVENATSLECLTLDTAYGCRRGKPGRCKHMGRDILMEAYRALLAIRTHIEGIIPSGVKLNVSEPCGRCDAVDYSF